MIKKLSLLPRYNLDFDLGDYIDAVVSIFAEEPDYNEVFESMFGQLPILTSSGRESLYIILKALDLAKGAIIGVPLYCCPVVFETIKRAGFTPRFVDIDPYSYTISLEDLERKKKSLAAVIAVHMFGHPADIDPMLEIVDGNFPIIEDCAHSLCSKYKERMTGSLGRAAFFSFRSAKYISAGEGGLILSNDPNLVNKMRKKADSLTSPKRMEELLHCTMTLMKSVMNKRPWYGLIGFPLGQLLDKRLNLTGKSGFRNAKMRRTDLSIIAKKLQGFPEKIERQRKHSFYLLNNIRSEKIILPVEKDGSNSNYYLFAIRCRNELDRNSISDFLLKKGIDNSRYLSEVISIASSDYHYEGDCPNAEMAAKTVVVIPNYYLLNEDEIDYVAEVLNEGLKAF